MSMDNLFYTSNVLLCAVCIDKKLPNATVMCLPLYVTLHAKTGHVRTW